MAEQNSSLNEAPSFHASELDFSPANCHQTIEHMHSINNVPDESTIKTILKDYSLQLVKLLDLERDLNNEGLVSAEVVLSEQLCELVERQLENRDKIELLFVELGRKMWKGQLPATSIAIVEQQYSESTGRLLNEDLHDEQWSAYFSAFQLSIDILNGRTLLI